jgi:hypothetical protein
MFLVQILLPRSRDDAAATRDAFGQTREELVQQFDGVTAYVRAPAEGAWVAPDGEVQHDDVVMVEVLTDSFDRRWWRTYADTLARRFGQDTIHIRALPAVTPGDDEPDR